MTDKLIAAVPAGVTILGMAEFNGKLIFATSIGVYQMEGNKLVAVPFENTPAPPHQIKDAVCMKRNKLLGEFEFALCRGCNPLRNEKCEHL